MKFTPEFQKHLREDITKWEEDHPKTHYLNTPNPPKWFTDHTITNDEKTKEKIIIFPKWWYQPKNEETQ